MPSWRGRRAGSRPLPVTAAPSRRRPTSPTSCARARSAMPSWRVWTFRAGASRSTAPSPSARRRWKPSPHASRLSALRAARCSLPTAWRNAASGWPSRRWAAARWWTAFPGVISPRSAVPWRLTLPLPMPWRWWAAAAPSRSTRCGWWTNSAANCRTATSGACNSAARPPAPATTATPRRRANWWSENGARPATTPILPRASSTSPAASRTSSSVAAATSIPTNWSRRWARCLGCARAVSRCSAAPTPTAPPSASSSSPRRGRRMMPPANACATPSTRPPLMSWACPPTRSCWRRPTPCSRPPAARSAAPPRASSTSRA